jgi:hypothetical protein
MHSKDNQRSDDATQERREWSWQEGIETFSVLIPTTNLTVNEIG